MSNKDLVFVSFKPDKGRFIAFFPMEQLLSSERDLEPMLKEAAHAYEYSLVRMRSAVKEIDSFRNKRQLLPARSIWRLGNLIFELVEGLQRLSLQIDGIYEHLVRDLGVKRKWLEKVIIFRRYIPDEDIIPQTLNWGRFEKGTRRKAEKLRIGVLPS
jgi:hypothetical protein